MSNLAKFVMLFCIAVFLAAVSLWFMGGKKREYTTSATVNATPDQIFPFVNDITEKKKWMQGLVEQQFVSAADLDEGVTEGMELSSVVESNGQVDEFNDVVIRFTENEIITIKSRNNRMMSTWSVLLEEFGDKTRMTYRRIIRFNGLERFKSVFYRDNYQREIEDEMSRLVKLVESRADQTGQSGPDGKAQDEDSNESATPSAADQQLEPSESASG